MKLNIDKNKIKTYLPFIIIIVLFTVYIVYTIVSYDKPINAFVKAEKTDDHNFTIQVGDYYVTGKIPNLVKNKFYIEPDTSEEKATFYSKYNYALSKMRNLDKTYGALFEIYIVRDEYKYQRLEKSNEKVVVLQAFLGNQYIVATVPKDNLYVEDDDVSKSNYDRLASYTDEIIDSIKVSTDKPEDFDEQRKQMEQDLLDKTILKDN